MYNKDLYVDQNNFTKRCVCKIPEPRMKNSENGVSSYCNKCAKSYSRCCEKFTCDVCYTETSNKKDDEDYRYCDSCNEL